MTLYRTQTRTHRIVRNVSGYDRWLTFSVVVLLAFGSVLVYAATKNWYASQHLDPQYYLKRHLINIFIGLAMAYGTTLIDYRLLRAYTPIVWGLGVLGLMAVLTPGVGSTVNGAKAWIALPGGFQIQPAELAKISIILGISMILAERNGVGADPTDRDVVKALAVAALPILLIMLQPDLGTTLIISASIVIMIAVSGAPSRWVWGLILLAMLGGFVAVKAGVVSEYQVKRLRLCGLFCHWHRLVESSIPATNAFSDGKFSAQAGPDIQIRVGDAD